MNPCQCLECGKSITKGINDYSIDTHGVPLCMNHQSWLDELPARAETIALYFALKHNKVPAVMNYQVGAKTIDIAIPGKLYIEVNAEKHLESATDFRINFHSWDEIIPTFSVANAQIDNPFQFKAIVERLVGICMDFVVM